MLRRLIFFFLVVTCMIGMIACYSIYRQKRIELLSVLDQQLFRVAEEYKDITEDFWEIYLPVFEDQNDNTSISQYFENNSVLSPVERFNLTEALSSMSSRDEKVQWIAIYSPKREINYIYFPVVDSMQVLVDDFPYLEKLTEKTRRMDIYPSEKIQNQDLDYESLAIVGGVPGNGMEGSIIVGYDIGTLQRLCEENNGFSSLSFSIAWGDRILFSTDKSIEWAE